MADNHDENDDLSTNDSIQAVIPVVKPKQKKQLSEKQLEALQRGRDARETRDLMPVEDNSSQAVQNRQM